MASEAEFLDVVERVQAAALDDDLWRGALGSIADMFDGASADIEVIDKRSLRPLFMDHSAEISEENANAYLNHYAAINPRIPPILSHPVGSIDYDAALFDDAMIAGDEFYMDFLASHDLRYFISGNLLNTGNSMGLMALQRTYDQGHVDQAEIVLMGRLMPHLQQALDLRFRLSRAEREKSAYLEGLSGLNEATLLVDGRGRILFESPLATDLFVAGDGIAAMSGTLNFKDRAAAGKLAASLASLSWSEGDKIDMGTRSFPARRSSGARPFIVSVRALSGAAPFADALLGAAAIVFIRDPETYTSLDADMLSQSYQLTPAETDLAVAFDLGASLTDIANRRGVSITTIRTQLYALMAKLGVNRQNDLVRLLRQYRQPF